MNHPSRFSRWAAVLALVILAACGAEPRRVRLVTTTSVRDTGLLDALLPSFTRETGIGVDVIAVGTGAAFQHGRDGNADLLLVHDRKGEDEFIAAGDGRERRDLMWNSFEIVGPVDDPATVTASSSASEAFARIAAAQAPFISRGDDSGTHRREKTLWKEVSIEPSWSGYVQTGQAMGGTLVVADERLAYVLTDRGTRLSYRKKLSLVPLLADTPDLRNEYAVVLPSPEKHPGLAHAEARTLTDWLVSDATSRRIDGFRVDGEPLFHPRLGAK